MKFFKHILIFALCVSLVSVSVGSKWFDANNISKVKAIDATSLELSAEVMALICAYVGSVYLAYTNNQEISSLSDEQIAEFGHNILKSATYSPTVYLDTLPGWSDKTDKEKQAVISFLDSQGQSYVFGSEALQETAEESWSVIQGGLNNHDDRDDDEDDDKVDNIIKFSGKVGECAFALPAAVATAFGLGIKQLYNDMHSNDAGIDLTGLFAPLDGTGFTVVDITNQWNGQSYIPYFKFLSVSNYRYYGNNTVTTKVFTNTRSFNYPIAYVHTTSVSDGKIFHHNVLYRRKGTGYDTDNLNGNISSSNSKGNHSSVNSTSLAGFDVSYEDPTTNSYVTTASCSISANIPVFDNYDSAIAYCKNGIGYEDALNYNKSFDIADWLQKDWSGSLVDPLTGLSGLSDWFNRARHTGLNSLGNEIGYDDMIDYLRDYFTNAGLGRDTVYDPLKDPIVYPSGVTVPTINPVVNPSIVPASDPSTDPGTNPGTNPGDIPAKDPDTDTDFNPEEIEDDIDEMDKSFGGLSDILKYKFPFCIPWDVLSVVGLFASEPKTPYFEIPIQFDISGIGISIDYTFVLDFKDFKMLSKVFRFVLSIVYCIGLMRITFNVAEMKKE